MPELVGLLYVVKLNVKMIGWHPGSLATHRSMP
jgi:hypothetical protein